jgi:hypothetical protein
MNDGSSIHNEITDATWREGILLVSAGCPAVGLFRIRGLDK